MYVVIFLKYKTKNNNGLEQVAYNDNLSSMILLKIAQSNSQAGLECLAITCLPQISGDDAWHHVACVSTSRSLRACYCKFMCSGLQASIRYVYTIRTPVIHLMKEPTNLHNHWDVACTVDLFFFFHTYIFFYYRTLSFIIHTCVSKYNKLIIVRNITSHYIRTNCYYILSHTIIAI